MPVKWVFEIKDGQVMDLSFGVDTRFIHSLIKQFEHSDDSDEFKKYIIPKLEEHLKKCKNQQRVYMVISDGGVELLGTLTDYLNRKHQSISTEFITENDMEFDDGN